MHLRPLVRAILAAPLAVAPLGCGEDLSGCGEPDDPVEVQRCQVVGGPAETAAAAPPDDLTAVPQLVSWAPTRVRLPGEGVGWAVAQLTNEDWAIVVDPPVPVEAHRNRPDGPTLGTTVGTACAAGALAIERPPFDWYWIRLGPTTEREVTVGLWHASAFACE